MSKASDHFHQAENYNCAQAVLAHFKQPAETVAEFKAFGGGNAPEGICGALYAARHILNDDAKFRQLCDEFAAQTGGALTCRALKSEAKFPCMQCVDLAAELVEKFRN